MQTRSMRGAIRRIRILDVPTRAGSTRGTARQIEPKAGEVGASFEQRLDAKEVFKVHVNGQDA